MELVFATHNKHKAAEINQLLGSSFIIKTLPEIGCTEDIDETGSTLQENASLKSLFIARQYKVNCFADDTGLMVRHLNGEPGVYSARYAGKQKLDADNMDLLLTNLKGVTDRSAYFETCISLRLNGQEYLFRGILNGHITTEKKGTNGFGYDPIFVPEGMRKTLAELTSEEKNNISHRAIATSKLIAFLNS